LKLSNYMKNQHQSTFVKNGISAQISTNIRGHNQHQSTSPPSFPPPLTILPPIIPPRKVEIKEKQKSLRARAREGLYTSFEGSKAASHNSTKGGQDLSSHERRPSYQDETSSSMSAKRTHLPPCDAPTPLPPLMKGPPPPPGCPEMVRETRECLSSPIRVGSSRYWMAEEDKNWFYCFSEVVVCQAATMVNTYSKKGGRIRNLPALLYANCKHIMELREQS
jgi:hypothetical protein